MVSKTMSRKTASYLCYSERCYFCKQTKDKQRNGTTRNTTTPYPNILLLNNNTHKVKLRKTAALSRLSIKKRRSYQHVPISPYYRVPHSPVHCYMLIHCC